MNLYIANVKNLLKITKSRPSQHYLHSSELSVWNALSK